MGPKGPVCQRCRRPLAGTYVQAQGAGWHPDCWLCAACGRKLDGPYVERGGQPYHPPCFEARFGLKCSLCQGLIQGKYYQHEGAPVCEACFQARLASRCFHCGCVLEGTFTINASGQKACARHNHGPACTSCGRWLEPSEFFLPGNSFGSTLCRGCLPSAVSAEQLSAYGDAFGAQVLRQAGLEMPPHPPVPLRLETADQILRLRGPLDKHAYAVTETRITTYGGAGTLRQIQGIALVGGLAKDHFEGALAHEFGHVWLFLKGREGLPDVEGEGFCEWLRHAWLTRLGTPLALELRQKLVTNPDPVYGGGFRTVQGRWERDQLKGVLGALGLG